MSLEMELFNFNEVRITDRNVRIRRRSYSLESLIGAEVIYRNRPWSPVLASLVASVSCEIAGQSVEKLGLHIAALFFLILTATLFWTGGPRYSIALDTAEGYFMPLTSADRFFVESVGQVLHTALQQDTHRMPTTQPVAASAIPMQPAFKLVPAKAQPQQPAFSGASFSSVLNPATHAKLFSMPGRVTHNSAI